MKNESSPLNKIFEDFNPNEGQHKTLSDRRSITIWLPPEYVEKYSMLQGQSRNKFGKKIQDIVKEAINIVAEKAG